jgi:hypothetical protein
MKRNKRTLTDKNGEELSTKSIALGQAMTLLTLVGFDSFHWLDS